MFTHSRIVVLVRNDGGTSLNRFASSEIKVSPVAVQAAIVLISYSIGVINYSRFNSIVSSGGPSVNCVTVRETLIVFLIVEELRAGQTLILTSIKKLVLFLLT